MVFDDLEDQIGENKPLKIAYKALSFVVAPLRDPLGYFMGGIEGAIESIFKDFVIPTSLREIGNELCDEFTNYEESTYDPEEVGKITALLTSHVAAASLLYHHFYPAIQNNDFSDVSFFPAALLATNVYSVGYEVYRYFRTDIDSE